MSALSPRAVHIPAERCIGGREISEPRLHPDGDLLVYVLASAGSAALMVHRFDGSPDRQLSSYPAPRAGRGMSGGCWCFAGDGRAVIYVAADGDLWRQPVSPADGPVTRLIPAGYFGGAGVSSPVASADGTHVVFCVDQAEVWDVHPISGALARLDDGADDFVTDPQIDPSCSTVTWIAWSVPNMPWDTSLVRRARLSPNGGLAAGVDLHRSSRHEPGVCMQQVTTLDDTSEMYICDRSGYLNLWHDDRPLVAEPFEHAGPMWGPGQRSYAVSSDGSRVAFTRNEGGFGRLCVVDRSTGVVTDVARAVHGHLTWVGNRLAALRSGAVTPTQLVVYDTHSWQRDVVAVGGLDGWDALPLVEPQLVTIDGPPVAGLATGSESADAPDRSATIHARWYRAAGDARGAIVWTHGGPTDQWQVTFMPRIAYWVAAGFHVVVPDHRGSTGHGRVYQQALRGRWGELDVADTLAVIEHAHRLGWSTPSTTLLAGASSGGFTTLCAVAAGAPVAGAIASMPVCDLVDLAERSHRFERHYTDTLVGPLPEFAEVARQRSPLTMVGSLARVPLLVIHGEDDPVVPAEQSVTMCQRIREAGGDVELHLYPGEGHGLRQPAHQLDEYRRITAFVDRVVPRRG